MSLSLTPLYPCSMVFPQVFCCYRDISVLVYCQLHHVYMLQFLHLHSGIFLILQVTQSGPVDHVSSNRASSNAAAQSSTSTASNHPTTTNEWSPKSSCILNFIHSCNYRVRGIPRNYIPGENSGIICFVLSLLIPFHERVRPCSLVKRC